MLRDVLLRYWPEWCHVVTVAVCKEKNKKRTPSTGANDADKDIPVRDLSRRLLFGSVRFPGLITVLDNVVTFCT